MEPPTEETSRPGLDRLSLLAPAFVNELLVPALSLEPGLTVRAISTPSCLVRRYVEAASGAAAFDAAVLVGEGAEVPTSWSCTHVEEVAYGLFTSPRVALSLGPTPSADDVRDLRFVAPVHVAPSGEIVRVDDRCPLGREDRWVTHEVADLRLALRIASETDRLVYAPSVAAAASVRDGSLVEVPVEGWSRTAPVQLSFRCERGRSRFEAVLTEALRCALGRAVSTSSVVRAATRRPGTGKRRRSGTR